MIKVHLTIILFRIEFFGFEFQRDSKITDEDFAECTWRIPVSLKAFSTSHEIVVVVDANHHSKIVGF